MKVIEIKAKNLNETNFKKFGTAILKPTDSAPKIGKNWDCWIALGKMGKIDASVGIVETRLSDENIDSMEAHGKPEFLVPIDGPIIQPVAELNESEKPDASKPAGKAKNPIPKIADTDPKNFPKGVIGKISP